MTRTKSTTPVTDSTIAISTDLRLRIKAWTAERGITMAALVAEVLEGVLAGKIIVKGRDPKASR